MNAFLALRDAGKRLTGIFRSQAEKDHISVEFRQRIERYFNRAEKDDTLISYEQRIEFLRSLPTSLQQKYLVELSKKRFKTLPVFEILQTSTLLKLALKIYEIYYSPMDMILESTKQRPDRISILKNGAVNFLCKKNSSELSGKIVHSFEVNWQNPKIKDPILLDQLFMEKTMELNYDVRAVKTSKVLHLNTSDFFDTIRQSKFDREYFFQIYHRHCLFPNEWCGVKCIHCLKQFHTLFDCPKLHYLPNCEIIYLKEAQPGSFRQKNERNIIFHRKRTKFRKKERYNCFLLIKQFKQMQKCLGLLPLKTKYKQSFHKNGNNLSAKYEEQIFQSDSKERDPFLESDRESSYKGLSNLSSPFQVQEVQTKQQNTDFYEREYLQKQNRFTTEEAGKKKVFCQLKNRLYNLIIQRLEPQMHGFWEIEIDKMHNYKNYFSGQNPERFNSEKLKKTYSQVPKFQKTKLMMM